MLDAADSFELALRVDACMLAYQRRAHRVHAPVDPLLVARIVRILRGHVLSPDDVYARIVAIQHVIDRLATKERDELIQMLAADRQRVPWRPDRGSQCLGFEKCAEVDEILLAGSAGSGKSEAAIGYALLHVDVARFVRSTVGELSSILARIEQLVGSVDGRRQDKGEWKIEPPFGFGQKGMRVEWAGISEPGARLKWQGRPFSMIVWDDVASGTMKRDDIEYLDQWRRSTSPNMRTLLCYTANAPTSQDSLWLRDEIFAPWLSPDYTGERAVPGEIRYFLRGEEVPAGTEGATSRTVVRSKTADNVRYIRSGYVQKLQNAPSEHLRQLLANDDWENAWREDDPMAVIPSSWVDAAVARWAPDAPCGLDAIGIDVARGGKDRSTIARRHGNWFNAPIVIPGSETPTGQALAARVLAVHERGGVAFIDATGVGSSPYDILREKVATSGVIFGAGTDELDATQSFGFSNIRSLLWWRMREMLNPESMNPIALPPDEALKRELCMPRYELRGGKLFVEDRASIIKRLGKSPDIATAYILAAISSGSTLAAHPQSDLLAALARSNTKWREAHAN